jgi:hypothetical protein
MPVMEHEPGVKNYWTPELFYDENEGVYLIYWATTMPGRFPATVSTGDNGYNHRIFYTTTKDFVNFTTTKLLFDPGFNIIDAVIVKTDSLYAMFFKDETLYPPHKYVYVARSIKLIKGWKTSGDRITFDWVEGPTVSRVDNKWVVYYDEYTRHKMGAVISEDLIQWTDISDRVHFPEGARHVTVFRVNREMLTNILDSE